MKNLIFAMAKRIKAIKCPQCGSTKAKELRPDYYRCDSCHTEFFIDSDDINIHHKYETPPEYINVRNVAIAIGSFVVFFIFIRILTSAFSSKPSGNDSHSVLDVKKEKEVVFWDRIYEFKGFANANGEGMILIIGSRGVKKGYSVSGEKESCFGIYQAIDEKEILIQPIKGFEKVEISDVDVKSFENGDVYAIINKKKLFKLNIATYELKEIVFETLNLPELAKGVYEIKFAYDGDGFEVVNELGKELYYFPIINKVYSQDAFYKARSKKMPDAKKQVAFQFSKTSDYFPDEKIQLIKYYYWRQIGYPTQRVGFQWTKDFGGSGIFTDKSPYRKVLVLPYVAETSRLISYSDFTPKREYMSGNVGTYDDSEVLISFSPTLSGNRIVQLLDTETAAIKWTMPADMPYLISEDVVKVKNGYLFTAHEKSWLFNTQTKEGKYIEWKFDKY